MRRSTFYILLLILLFSGKGFAQPSWYPGTLLFNLTERPLKKNDITLNDIKSKNIRFLSTDKESIIKYDTIHKAFSYTTNKGYEVKTFAVVYQKDTIFIDFPSASRQKKTNAVFVKQLIPLNEKSFSFYDNKILDAMNANCAYNKIDIFYLVYGSIIHNYEMSEERRKQLSRHLKWHNIELKEE